ALIGIGYGTVGPAIKTISINIVPANRRGTATATFFTFFYSGLGIWSFILGIVAAHKGLGQLYLYLCLIVIASIVIYYVLHGRRQTEKKKERQFQVNVQKRVEEEGLWRSERSFYGIHREYHLFTVAK